MQLGDRTEARTRSPWGRLFGDSILRKPEAGASAGPACAAMLRQVMTDLDLLNRRTEQDFLEIGGKLTGFMEGVKRISSELTGLALHLSGEQGLRASSALASALNRSKQMLARSAAGSKLLSSMYHEAAQMKRTLSEFQGTLSSFHTIAVLTRVETARLGSAGADFGSLADDMKLLAGDVKDRIENALDTTHQLLPPIETALQRVSRQQEGQAKDLPRLITEVDTNLASFDAMQNRAHDSSIRLATRYTAISDEFTKLIVSIQFQDITRQKIEHVIEALRKLSTESAGGRGALSHDDRNLATILALQSSQMADAGEKFASSAASVTHSLDVIVQHVEDMAGECRTLTGRAGGDCSFLLEMERGCTAILDGLSECAEAERAMIVTSAGLAESMDQMRGALKEIRAIEIQIQRMALNAGIRATLIGASGDALCVLAGSMRELARESERRSERLGESLNSMTQAVNRLCGQDESAPVIEGGGVDGMRTAISEWHSSGERSFAQISQIVTLSADLCSEVSATRCGFSVGLLFR